MRAGKRLSAGTVAVEMPLDEGLSTRDAEALHPQLAETVRGFLMKRSRFSASNQDFQRQQAMVLLAILILIEQQKQEASRWWELLLVYQYSHPFSVMAMSSEEARCLNPGISQ